MSTTVAELADRYQEAMNYQSECEADLRYAKDAVLEAKNNLIDAMLEEETDSIGRNGRRYSLTGKAKYSKRAGMEQELFELLREHGLGDIITETVNANTLGATMRQMAEDNGGELPEEWQDCINTYEYTDISVRKS